MPFSVSAITQFLSGQFDTKRDALLGPLPLLAVYALGFETLYLDLTSSGMYFSLYRLDPHQVFGYLVLLAVVVPLGFVAISGILNLKAIPRRVAQLIRWPLFVFLLYVCFRNAINTAWHTTDTVQLLAAVGLTFCSLFLVCRFKALAVEFLTILSGSALIVPLYFMCLPGYQNGLFPQDISPQPVATKTPVILIIFDELPVTHLLKNNTSLEAELYPQFQALKQTSTFFPNTLSTAAYTYQAIPSILEGEQPQLTANGEKCLATAPVIDRRHPGIYDFYTPKDVHADIQFSYAIPASIAQENTQWQNQYISKTSFIPFFLVDILKMYVVSKLSCQPLSRFYRQQKQALKNLNEPLDEIDTRIAQLKKQPKTVYNRETLHILARRIEARLDIDPTKKLYIFHAPYPHQPLSVFPSGRYLDNENEFVKRRFENCKNQNDFYSLGCFSNETINTFYLSHQYQTQRADAVLGLILEPFKKAGLFDKALIIVTADHGISFRAQVQTRAAAPENLAEIASVPLFVKFPHQKVGTVRQDVRYLTDIYPTIATSIRVPETRWKKEHIGIPLQSLGQNRKPHHLCSIDNYFALPPNIAQQKWPIIRARQTTWTTDHNWIRYSAVPKLTHYLGQPISRVPQTHLSNLPATVLNPSPVVELSKKTQTIPGMIEGVVLDKTQGRHVVLITINDTIQIITRTTVLPELPRYPVFEAVIPERSLRTGTNTIQAYVYNDTHDKDKY